MSSNSENAQKTIIHIGVVGSKTRRTGPNFGQMEDLQGGIREDIHANALVRLEPRTMHLSGWHIRDMHEHDMQRQREFSEGKVVVVEQLSSESLALGKGEGRFMGTSDKNLFGCSLVHSAPQNDEEKQVLEEVKGWCEEWVVVEESDKPISRVEDLAAGLVDLVFDKVDSSEAAAVLCNNVEAVKKHLETRDARVQLLRSIHQKRANASVEAMQKEVDEKVSPPVVDMMQLMWYAVRNDNAEILELLLATSEGKNLLEPWVMSYILREDAVECAKKVIDDPTTGRDMESAYANDSWLVSMFKGKPLKPWVQLAQGPKIFRWLVESGAEVEAVHEDDDGTKVSLLCNAVVDGSNLELVKAMLEVPSIAETVDMQVQSVGNADVTQGPLHIACGRGNLEIAEALINAGADVTAENNMGQTWESFFTYNQDAKERLQKVIDGRK